MESEEPWNGPYLPLGSSTPKMLKLINLKSLSIFMKQRT